PTRLYAGPRDREGRGVGPVRGRADQPRMDELAVVAGVDVGGRRIAAGVVLWPGACGLATSKPQAAWMIAMVLLLKPMGIELSHSFLRERLLIRRVPSWCARSSIMPNCTSSKTCKTTARSCRCCLGKSLAVP